MECHGIAVETVELRDTKTADMMSLVAKIRATLEGFSEGGIDASALAAIQDLIAGDKMKAAMALELEWTIWCVSQSVKMIDVLERGMDSLPDIAKVGLKEASKRGDQVNDDLKLTNVDRHIQDITPCVDTIKELNLFTSMRVGVDAPSILVLKTKLPQAMLTSVRGLTHDVVNVTDTVSLAEL